MNYIENNQRIEPDVAGLIALQRLCEMHTIHVQILLPGPTGESNVRIRATW
jgi:hypothetical protein